MKLLSVIKGNGGWVMGTENEKTKEKRTRIQADEDRCCKTNNHNYHLLGADYLQGTLHGVPH